MPKMYFTPVQQEIFKGLPAAQTELITQYANDFKEHSEELHSQLGYAGSAVPRVKSANDKASDILSKLIQSGFDNADLEDRFDPKAISRKVGKMARLVTNLWWPRVLPEDQSPPMEALIQETAIGFVGVHVAIWSPDQAEGRTAKPIFVNARDNYDKNVLGVLTNAVKKDRTRTT